MTIHILPELPEGVELGSADHMPTDSWGEQIVWLPLTKLLHYERSECERREWAARNLELQKEIERLRAGKGD